MTTPHSAAHGVAGGAADSRMRSGRTSTATAAPGTSGSAACARTRAQVAEIDVGDTVGHGHGATVEGC